MLAQQGAVPDDASVVIAAGPQIDFFPTEIDALKNYLEKNGKLLLELDPPDKAGQPAARPISSRWRTTGASTSATTSSSTSAGWAG